MIDFFEVKKLKILGKVTNEPKKYSAEVRTYGTNYDGGISPPVIYPYIDNIQEFPGKICGEITEPEIGEEYIILTVSDTLILVTNPKLVEDIHYMMMDYYKNFKYKMRNLAVELENKIDKEENRFDQINWWC